MSNFHPHAEEVTLVRWLDGELPAAEARQLEQHLDACWQCRTEVEALRGTVADCVRYRQQVLETLPPPPPAPWADLRPEFARLDAAVETEPWWRRFTGSIQPPMRWALATALTLAVAAGLFYQLRETPSVQAAALLQRAEVAAARRPSAPRRVLIRTPKLQMVHAVGTARLLQEPPAPALEALFRQAHWDWNDPLSARAFSGCSAGLSNRRDSVIASGSTYQIRSETNEGVLSAASLTLRATDLAPLSARLEFRDQDWIELSEFTEDRTQQDDGSTVAPHGAESPSRRAEPSRSAVPPSGEAASISSELQVIAALHGIGADLGDPVEVTRNDGRLKISGIGIAPLRQKEIASAVHGIPNVSVDFSDPGVAASNPDTAAPVVSAPNGTPAGGGIASRVERQLGGRPQFERFSSQLLDWNEMALSRAYALHHLAERFPVAAEASLSAADRRTLRNMAREHAAAFSILTGKIRRTADPVLTALGGQAANRPQAADGWQSAAEDLLLTTKRVELRLSVMLGASPGDGSAFNASELLTDLAHLDDAAARCQRLLAQE